MREKLKGTRNFYAQTSVRKRKSIVSLNLVESNWGCEIAYVYKQDRTRIHLKSGYSIVNNPTTRKALVLFINEYCAYPYGGEVKKNISKDALFEFLSKEYGFNFKYKNSSQKELTGLDT